MPFMHTSDRHASGCRAGRERPRGRVSGAGTATDVYGTMLPVIDLADLMPPGGTGRRRTAADAQGPQRRSRRRVARPTRASSYGRRSLAESRRNDGSGVPEFTVGPTRRKLVPQGRQPTELTSVQGRVAVAPASSGPKPRGGCANGTGILLHGRGLLGPRWTMQQQGFDYASISGSTTALRNSHPRRQRLYLDMSPWGITRRGDCGLTDGRARVAGAGGCHAPGRCRNRSSATAATMIRPIRISCT